VAKITVVDIQHKSFKKKLQGYDPVDVDQYLDEIIETLEDEAHARAALAGEVADLKERISHFKAMEESLQSTLLLAQRTADEVKASAHKEADLIKQEARLAAEREIAALGDRIEESRREAQRAQDTAEQAKSELRSLLMSHLSLIDRAPLGVPHAAAAPASSAPVPAPAPAPAASAPVPVAQAQVAAPEAPTAEQTASRPVIKSETDEFERLPSNGVPERRLVE
jgi:cell division initiation protein